LLRPNSFGSLRRSALPLSTSPVPQIHAKRLVRQVPPSPKPNQVLLPLLPPHSPADPYGPTNSILRTLVNDQFRLCEPGPPSLLILSHRNFFFAAVYDSVFSLAWTNFFMPTWLRGSASLLCFVEFLLQIRLRFFCVMEKPQSTPDVPVFFLRARPCELCLKCGCSRQS